MKYLRASLFSLGLLTLTSTALYAGVAASEGPAQEEQESVPVPEFSMENVSLLKMRGGNYWTGFFLYSVDLDKAELHANWNRMDCSMKKAEGRAALTAKDIESIKAAVMSLSYEPIEEGEPCYLMADGDESSLRLLSNADDKDAPAYYPMKSWYSRCEGKPLSNESYAKFEKVIFGILPQPELKEAWSDVDPNFSCTREVTVSIPK